jgi:tRNASer (uridine44-2'-O)-methyltransferase
MMTPPTVQTPPCKPGRPDHVLVEGYRTPYTTPCHFTLSTFLHVLKELTLHPERNSSLILRADPIPLDTQSQIKSSCDAEDLELDEGLRGFIEEQGLEKVDEVRVRLMPKQPKRDGKLDQRVLFYRSKEKVEHAHPTGEGVGDGNVEFERGLVVMLPLVKAVEEIPFFHPPVKNLVFYYVERPESTEDRLIDGIADLSTRNTDDKAAADSLPVGVETSPVQGRISISYLSFPSHSNIAATGAKDPASTTTPFLGIRTASLPRKRSPLAGPDPTPAASTPAPLKEDQKVIEARLDRTCLGLLERVYKHGFGQMVGYKKRVNHDVRCLCHHSRSVILTFRR